MSVEISKSQIASGNNYDIIISGGGLVGASLAIALADLPLKIALVEAVLPDNAGVSSFDERSIALSRTSKTILNTLGVWSGFQDEPWAIDQIHVSEKGRFGTALLDAEEQGIDHLGHVVKSRVIGQSLWQRLSECSAIEVFCPARVATVTTEDTGVQVSIEGDDSRHIRGSLLIVADGARSSVREQLGVAADNKSYEQAAIIGNVSIDKQYAGHIAYERFTHEGPVALLPGADGVYTFVLTRHSDEVDSTMALSDSDMLTLLQQVFGHRLGVFRKLGKRFSYPLYLTTTEALTADHAIIIGNAAHGLHPVAGQGFNLGLRDAATLAEVVADAIANSEQNAAIALRQSIPEIQKHYSEWRRNDQQNVVRFTDGLIRFFAAPSNMVGIMRGLTLLGFDTLPTAKTSLARYAMGLGGRMTKLARGVKPESSKSGGPDS